MKGRDFIVVWHPYQFSRRRPSFPWQAQGACYFWNKIRIQQSILCLRIMKHVAKTIAKFLPRDWLLNSFRQLDQAARDATENLKLCFFLWGHILNKRFWI